MLILEAEFLPAVFKLMPIIFSVFGLLLSLFLYIMFYKNFLNLFKYQIYRTIYIFLNRKWFFDLIYNHFIVYKVLFFAQSGTFLAIDKGF